MKTSNRCFKTYRFLFSYVTESSYKMYVEQFCNELKEYKIDARKLLHLKLLRSYSLIDKANLDLDCIQANLYLHRILIHFKFLKGLIIDDFIAIYKI